MNVDRTIASHALFAADLYRSDAVGRAASCRRLAAAMVRDDSLACCEQCNAENLHEAVVGIADQMLRIANYIATGEEDAQ